MLFFCISPRHCFHVDRFLSYCDSKILIFIYFSFLPLQLVISVWMEPQYLIVVNTHTTVPRVVPINGSVPLVTKQRQSTEIAHPRTKPALSVRPVTTATTSCAWTAPNVRQVISVHKELKIPLPMNVQLVTTVQKVSQIQYVIFSYFHGFHDQFCWKSSLFCY